MKLVIDIPIEMIEVKALDDENTKDKHTFYTFACGTYEIEE